MHCCCNINGDTRIRIFLLIMSELPGRVSGFSPPLCPGTPAASPQRRLPCRDELLTGPKTGRLMLCQARHGAAGMLAASWPAPCITGLNPFYPWFPPTSLSLLPHHHTTNPPSAALSGASGLLCKAFQVEMWEFFQAQMYPHHICTIFRAVALTWEQPLSGPSGQVWGCGLTWDRHARYLPSNSNFSSSLQITADSCWSSTSRQR